MTTDKRETGPLRTVTDTLTRVAKAANHATAGGSHINVARRTNVQVATNIGRDGGTEHASATQEAPIIQNGRATDTEGTNNSPSGE